MERISPVSRITFLCILLLAITLSTHPTDARGLSRPTSSRYGIDSPPQALDSDAELMRALDFLERYERAKNKEQSEEAASPFMGGDIGVPGDYAPYRMQNMNNIPPMQGVVEGGIPYRALEWDDEDDQEKVDMEDLYPPRPEDLETNEVAYAEDVLDNYRDYESDRQRKLFEKILGDVVAERLLEQDEEDNIARLLEEQQEEEQGMDDLAAIFNPSSEMGSSEAEAEAEVYDPEDVASSIFSVSSDPEEEEMAAMSEDSPSSVAEGVPDAADDNLFLSEAGLEALDQAEEILNDRYGESLNGESLPDFEDMSDLASFFQEGDMSDISEEDSSEEEKEEVLKDVIYRIVEDTLRRKLVESMDEDKPTRQNTFMESSIDDAGSSTKEEETIDEDDVLLDDLVDEIHMEVDKLSSKILKKIKGGSQNQADASSSESRENPIEAGIGEAPSSDGYFNNGPIDGMSSSVPDDVLEEVLGEEPSGLEEGELSSASSAVDDGALVSDEDLVNAIIDIVPDTDSKVCPVLDYIVDDCSVIDGLRGLGSGGYREAFGRPCNRHQICYTCSTSYGIPTNLCDEIYKAELLTLCNGDPECKQRAKYFWLAATNDRTPPNFPLSICSDSCVLDYLLSD